MPLLILDHVNSARISRRHKVASAITETGSVLRQVRRVLLGLLAVLPVLLGLAVITPATAEMDSRADALWRTLRERFPYHVQSVALSDAGKDGERVLIIAEPPPTLQRTSFRQALKSIFGNAVNEAEIEIKKHPVGYDGWVADIIATLRYPKGSDGDKQLRDDLALLAQRLHGTSYKFAPIRVPFTTHPATPAAPSLSVSAAELKNWLLDSTVSLVSLDAGTSHHLNDLLAARGRPGVYLSEQRGLVILVLPRDHSINAYHSDVRKFTLDTDAIVGAIAVGNKRLALIGRERDTSLEAVPPLRVESILTLAATRKVELGQSYERNSAFAGKLPAGADVGKDWAPIYLSYDLINTEFGSLLNITDQMLKSWSEAGKVEYIRFDYKKPTSFPFKDGLLRHLGSHGVTYNWNTVGVGSVFTFGDERIFSLTRTGSLPVSYFPKNEDTDKSAGLAVKASNAEDTSYNYFSSLRDPYLGRVVQYAAIYQIFRAFPVDAKRNEDLPTNYGMPTDVLLETARKTLDMIASGKAVLNPDYVRAHIDPKATKLRFTPAQWQRYEFIVSDLEEKIANAKDILDSQRERFGEDVTDHIATILVDRSSLDTDTMRKIRRIIFETQSDADLEQRFNDLTEREHNALVDMLLLKSSDELEALKKTLLSVVDLDAEKNRFVHAASEVESSYIKTPSIVLSRYGSMVGGHNLYSHATTIEISPNVLRGQVIIDTTPEGLPILRIHPDDAPRSSELARVFERHGDETNVKQLLQAELARGGTVREMKVALVLDNAPQMRDRGLTLAQQGDLTVGETGFRVQQPASTKMWREMQADAEARGLDMVLARDADGYLVLRVQPKPPQAVRAASEPAMLEVMNGFAEQTAATRLPSGQPPLRLGTGDNLGEGELWGIIQTQELRTASGGGHGGWKPPSDGNRTISGNLPERGQPEGYFFRFDGDHNTAMSYSTRRGVEDPLVLRIAAKDSKLAEMALREPVEWSKAEVKPLGSSPGSGPYAGMVQIAYEIRIPLKAEIPNSSFWGKSMLVKIVGYFKRALSPVEVKKVNKALTQVIEASTKHDTLPIDGIALLKAEILLNVQPAHLQFHITTGTDDLIIVERANGNVGSDHLSG